MPADFLKGIKISATSPVDTPKDPSIKQYYAVLDKFGASDVDKTRATGRVDVPGHHRPDVATQNLKGEATPATIIAAAKAMPWSVLPASGGFHIRCNGKAAPTGARAPARTPPSWPRSNAQGKATSYTPVNDTQIPS